MKIDLHIHTNNSDGVLTAKEVIDRAVQNNVNVISITDHDTLEAYNDEIFEYAKERKVKLIKGIEISTKFNGVGVHVLGYNIDIDDENLKNELYKIRNARHIYLHDVAQKLKELGYQIDEKALDQIDAVTKAHIAENVIKLNSAKLQNEFGHIPNKGEFIETVMNEGCKAYVEKKSVTPAFASKIIKEAGGKVVLAHPVAYTYEDNLSEEDVKKIVDSMQIDGIKAIDGIEANYLYVDRENNLHDDCKTWNRFAEACKLFVTVGSDYHFSDGLRPEIGGVEITSDEAEKIISEAGFLL